MALLYTSVSGMRRLRIHNLSFPVCNDLNDLYSTCETDAIMNYELKKAVKLVLSLFSKVIIKDLCCYELWLKEGYKVSFIISF